MVAKKVQEPKRGKPCPLCGKTVANRSAICPHCEHVFEAKAKPSAKPRKNGGLAEIDVAMFALAKGGVDKAKAEIAKLQSSPAIDFAISCGGTARAIEALEKLHGRYSATA